MALKKPLKPTSASSASSAQAGHGKCLTGWPNVLDFLSTPVWEDGTRRETGKLTLYCEFGRWKAVVQDRELKRVAFLSAETPDDLLSVLDDGLGSDSLDWRVEKVFPPNGRK
jgi:hypothetical protein